MEQKTKSTAAAQRASQIKTLRTEASDTVRHGWLAMTGMNALSVLIPLLIPVAYVALAVLLKLPLTAETVVCGVVALLAGMTLQAYFIMGQAKELLQAAAGKEIRVRTVMDRMEDAGRALALFLLGLIVLCASVVPGAAIAWWGWSLAGWWKIIVTALGGVIALALLVVVTLSGCLSLFIMAEDGECGAAVALLRSARLMKGHKRQLVKAVAPALLILLALAATMALLLWPLAVKRDVLTDTLMYAGGVTCVIAVVYMHLWMQTLLACLCNSIVKE